MPWSTSQSANRATRYTHTAVAANATNSSDGIDILGAKTISIQMVHASHDDTSTWRVQSSNDGGTSWDAIAGTSTTTSGASGSATLIIEPVALRTIRINITDADANASATLTPYLVVNKM